MLITAVPNQCGEWRGPDIAPWEGGHTLWPDGFKLPICGQLLHQIADMEHANVPYYTLPFLDDVFIMAIAGCNDVWGG